MTRHSVISSQVLLIAPVGRDAELGCGVLRKRGIACRNGRILADLDAVPLEDLCALVLTEEALTACAVEALCARLDGQAPWSKLSVILLVDAARFGSGQGAGKRLMALVSRPGTILLQRPLHEETLLTVVCAAVADRRRQWQLRDELQARKAAEARARTLAHEMQHRVKNAFAVASSIAQQTFRRAKTLDDAREGFTSRLNAMAQAQDLATMGTDGDVDLRELADRIFAPYQSTEGPDRIDIDGPTISIPGDKATALAMALHELATNAAKYGALSVAGGRASFAWRWDETAQAGELAAEWRESGGPPVNPPSRRGFGSLLVEKALAGELGGTTELVFDPAGVVCRIKATLK